ncbi:DUF3300 domain-containing protein [Teichococcus oryzae]|uniref:DUF3300 domain-containing protein n=1 Tax=Teichococcus oryzae TaxID=1608942 RepID=A0A5B2TGA8_9PROT|nr:DUF3300 domain-containing protein [Pseudoroseomonas oryzae]KAA2212840.1 DUF3300 domain-containing protein [Pseudoroseomonas oryzae]
MSLPIGATGSPGCYRSLTLCLATCFGISTMGGPPVRPAMAQDAPPPAAAPALAAAHPADSRMTQPQLEQLLAPIALYPDSLLAEMLIASSYPLEVVQAQRWLGREANAKLQGEALAQALQQQPWDDSVKSLVLFPDVLKMMNDQLEWTQQLGDAVLAQQADVLNAVQVLRNRAQQAGKLESGSQQTITVSQNVPLPRQVDLVGEATPVSVAVAPPPQIITIEPAQPDQIHVPAYNPAVVYGPWPYPSYPPPYYPPPAGWGVGNALLTGMAFAGGVALVGSIWGGAGCGWNSGDININSSRVRNVDRSRTTGDVGNRWQHNSAHRQGVAYRNEEVRNRFQGDRPGSAAARDQFRGRVEQADRGGSALNQRASPSRSNTAGTGQGARAGPSPPVRAGAGERASAAGGTRASGSQGGATRASGAQGSGTRTGAAQGSAVRAGGERAAGGGANSLRHAPSGRPAVSGQAAQDRRGTGATRGAQSFQGIGQGGDVRTASQRGQASRQSPPSARPAAGGGGRTASVGGRGGGGRGR